MSSGVVLDRPHEGAGDSRRKRALNRSLSQLITLLGRIGGWIQENHSRLKRVYFVASDGGFTLYAVPNSTKYDSELTRLLCDLIVDLGDEGYDAHCAQVPDGTADELAAFFDPSQALILTPQ